MSYAYPRVADATYKHTWVKARQRHPNDKSQPICCICKAPATHIVWVQVSWFRGDDEGPFKTCKGHRYSAANLLKTKALKEKEA